MSAARTMMMAMSLFLAASAVAKPRTGAASPPDSGVVRDALACRTIAVPADRLSCFDRTMTALDAASRSRGVYVVDGEQVKAARRSLFGFNIPSTGLFAAGKPQDTGEDVPEIAAAIADATQDADGDWIVILDTGARWHQTDQAPLGFRPRPGQSLVIRRAALGAYKMSIGGRPAIKVRREG